MIAKKILRQRPCRVEVRAQVSQTKRFDVRHWRFNYLELQGGVLDLRLLREDIDYELDSLGRIEGLPGGLELAKINHSAVEDVVEEDDEHVYLRDHCLDKLPRVGIL